MKPPVPVLILDNSFTFGGAINSLGHLLKAMDRRRFLPVVVSGQPQADLDERFPGTNCIHFRARLPWVDNARYLRLASLPVFRRRRLRSMLNLARFCWWLVAVTLPETLYYVRLGRRHRIGLVHLNNILGSQLAGILAARVLRVPCVAHLRDFEEVHPVTRFYAGLIDHHVAISAAIRENLRQLRVPQERISVVHDAVDLEDFAAGTDCAHLLREFGLTPEGPRFGIFGRVVAWKGIGEFLLAAQQVLEQMPGARAFVVGGVSDGDEAYLAEMRELAVALGIADRVVFTGSRRDVPALMKLMDVVVHASNRPEPFGMVLIEGMAMGRAVVATAAGGPLDILAGKEAGLLVPPGDPGALAAAVLELLRDADLRRAMGAHGRLEVERRFSSRVCAQHMEDIFQRVLAR